MAARTAIVSRTAGTIAVLKATRPELPVHVGGGHQRRLEEAHQLGHALGPAAEQLAAALTRVG